MYVYMLLTLFAMYCFDMNYYCVERLKEFFYFYKKKRKNKLCIIYSDSIKIRLNILMLSNQNKTYLSK